MDGITSAIAAEKDNKTYAQDSVTHSHVIYVLSYHVIIHFASFTSSPTFLSPSRTRLSISTYNARCNATCSSSPSSSTSRLADVVVVVVVVVVFVGVVRSR